MKYTFLLAMLWIAFNANAQVKRLIFNDNKLLPDNTAKANGYGLIGKVSGDSLYRFKKFDIYNQLLVEGAYRDEAMQLPEGVFSYYQYIDDFNFTAQTSFSNRKKSIFLSNRGSFHNGEMTGKWLSYYPDGKVKNEIMYLKGIKNGEYFSFDKKGKLLAKGNYSNNLRNGTWTYIEDILETSAGMSSVVTKKILREYHMGTLILSKID